MEKFPYWAFIFMITQLLSLNVFLAKSQRLINGIIRSDHNRKYFPNIIDHKFHMNIRSPNPVRPSSTPKHTYNYEHSGPIPSKNSRIQISGVRSPQSKYGKSHMTQTSFYNIENGGKIASFEKPQEKNFAETSPNFGISSASSTSKKQYPIPYSIVESQPLVPRAVYAPQVVRINRLPLRQSKPGIDDKIDFMMSKHQEMKKQVDKLKETANKQNKAARTQNQYMQTLKSFYSDNENLKKEFACSRNEAEKILLEYSKKLEQNNAYISELQRKEYENFIPRALVEQILNIHEYTLKEQETFKRSYDSLLQQLQQTQKKAQNDAKLNQNNLKQLLEDIEALKQKLKQAQAEKQQANQLKNQFETLYDQKKKDFDTLKLLQSSGPSNSPKHNQEIYEKRVAEFENVSKQRQKKIHDLREENLKLQEQISGLKASAHKEDIKEMEEQFRKQIEKWEQQCEELEEKLEKQINNRLSIEGKYSLTAIENERLRKDTEKLKKNAAQQQVQQNRISITINKQKQQKYQLLKSQLKSKSKTIAELESNIKIKETKQGELNKEILKKNETIWELKQKLAGVENVFHQMNELEQKLAAMNSQKNSEISCGDFVGFEEMRSRVLELETLTVELNRNERIMNQNHVNHILSKFGELLNLMSSLPKQGERHRQERNSQIEGLGRELDRISEESNYIREIMRSTLSEIDILCSEMMHNDEVRFTRECIPKIRRDISNSLQILSTH